MSHALTLTTTANRKTNIYVNKLAKGVYELCGCDDFDDLSMVTLAFPISNLPSDVVNKDYSSDSFGCFKMSEHLSADDFEFQRGRFQAQSLTALQRRLNQMPAALVTSDEY